MAELIVALDVQTRAEAEAKVKLLGDSIDFYKIGLELFTAEGPDVVKAVKDFGKKVFLDLNSALAPMLHRLSSFFSIPTDRFAPVPLLCAVAKSGDKHMATCRIIRFISWNF